MKKIVFLLFLSSNIAFGQIAPKSSFDKPYFPKLKDILRGQSYPDKSMQPWFYSESKKAWESSIMYPGYEKFFLQGKPLGTNKKGSIFLISPDYMICFVPELSNLEKMPIKSLPFIYDPMPVAGPGIRLIPKTE